MMDNAWQNPDWGSNKNQFGFDSSLFGGGLGQFLGGLFGNSDDPYKKAQEQYEKWGNKAEGAQRPWQQAGEGAIGDYQKWLQSQENPGEFVNNLMADYQESPYANYLQKQSLRAGQNAASAGGLSGSTPLFQQLQQNAGNISSEDMQKWLQNVLGVNTQYGQGQQNLIQGGQGAANHLTDFYNQMGNRMGENAWNQERGRQNDFWNKFGGIGSMIGSFFL